MIQRREGDPYGNLVAGLKKHMKGEWNGTSGASLDGGHWLPGMKAKWSTNVQLDSQDDGASDGLYFSALPKSSGDLPSFTSGARPSWHIRKGGVTSGVKTQSSFWPPSWGWSDFENYLSVSTARSQAHQWDTTNYGPGKIKWDSTSSGLNAYPIGWTNSRL